jgi:hypothetical protein
VVRDGAYVHVAMATAPQKHWPASVRVVMGRILYGRGMRRLQSVAGTVRLRQQAIKRLSWRRRAGPLGQVDAGAREQCLNRAVSRRIDDLDWSGDRIVGIRHFVFARYTVEGAEVIVME